jgi:uncharacterized membrane protein YcaP (DUF421 family)
MDPVRIAIRCLFSFLVLLAMVRLSGKRLISHAGAFDFVLSLIAGDLVDDVIFAEVPVLQFVVGISALFVCELSAGILVHRSREAVWLLEGRPAILVEKGFLDPKSTKSEMISEEEVEALLRLKGFEKEKWHQIKVATIEASGDYAVLKEASMQSAQKKDRSKLL